MTTKIFMQNMLDEQSRELADLQGKIAKHTKTCFQFRMELLREREKERGR